MKHLIIAVSLLLFAAACKQGTQQPAPTAGAAAGSATDSMPVVSLTEEQFRRAGITIAQPEIKPVNRVLTVNGTVEAPPQNKHTISFPLGGYLKTNHLIPGMYVKKGALLATMEDVAFIQLQQDYLLSKSRLEFLEADYFRQQELNKTQSNSQRTFQQAKADYESEQVINRALAEKLRLIGIRIETLSGSNLSRTVAVYAPIAGYISKVNVNPGKYVAPTDVLFELIDPSAIHLSLTVFENDAALLKRGQKVYCSSNTNRHQKIPATIHLITPDLNASRAVEVHCDFDEPAPGLLPGSFINATIILDNQSGTTLPDDAIVQWQNNHYIFTEVHAKNYRMMKIATGNSQNGLTEIKTSLPPGVKVVTSNAYALLTMLKNTPEEE